MSLGHRAHYLILHLTALDDEQIRDAAHAVARGDLRIVVDVDLDHLEAAVVLARQLVDRWGDRLARPAPWGPEIDQNRLIGLQHFGIEVSVSHMRNFVACHSFSIATDGGCLRSNLGTTVRAVKATARTSTFIAAARRRIADASFPPGIPARGLAPLQFRAPGRRTLRRRA